MFSLPARWQHYSLGELPCFMRSLYYCLQKDNLSSEMPIGMVCFVVLIVRKVYGPCIATSYQRI